jgi:5-methylcytosine-specific restriction endonuclease McrA
MTMLDHYRTLMLDAAFRPIRDIHWTRAVALDLQNKVTVVETYDRVVRSPSIEMLLPAVVALKHYNRHHPYRIRFSKRNVILRDGCQCQYCGKVFPASELTIDHILPRSRGGRSTWENVVTACGKCNAQKGDSTPQEARMPLLSTPTRPIALSRSKAALHRIPHQWREYIVEAK